MLRGVSLALQSSVSKHDSQQEEEGEEGADREENEKEEQKVGYNES